MGGIIIPWMEKTYFFFLHRKLTSVQLLQSCAPRIRYQDYSFPIPWLFFSTLIKLFPSFLLSPFVGIKTLKENLSFPRNMEHPRWGSTKLLVTQVYWESLSQKKSRHMITWCGVIIKIYPISECTISKSLTQYILSTDLSKSTQLQYRDGLALGEKSFLQLSIYPLISTDNNHKILYHMK